MTDNQTLISQIKERILTFCEVRNWRKDAQPRDLAISISLECAELLEHFQWDANYSCEKIKSDKVEISHLSHELADILIYAVLFADRLNIDLSQIINNKLVLNEKKYPQKLFKSKKISLKQYKKIKQIFRSTSIL